jgi:exo-beta-1,3-glucanase (GH17 family)
MTRALLLVVVAGCARNAPLQPWEPPRPFPPVRDGQPLLDGVAYGPYRAGQRPGGPDPTAEQIREDLALLSPRFTMIRLYSSRGPAETVLQALQQTGSPLQVMVGAWLSPDDAAANAAEVAEAIRLANTYPEQVAAVSVGNETQVSWSGHRVDRAVLLGALREVRGAVRQPVTTADDYSFWDDPEAREVAAAVDFIGLHAYAMWNGRSLDDALGWTATTTAAIRALHPDRPVVLCETGWATAMNPEGRETQHVRAPAGEAEQAAFFAAFTAWARADGLPHFWFEAFDEPWKGADDPREIEKHWGLYDVDRQPKAVLQGEP